jgi:signal transduction histidine kinase
MVRRTMILQLALVALLALGAVFAQLPQAWLGGGLVAGGDLSRSPAWSDLRPYRFEPPGREAHAAGFQQMRAIVERERGASEITLILIDADERTRIYLNNIRLPPNRVTREFDGRAFMVSLPVAFWHDGANTLDLITPAAGGRLGAPLAVLARSDRDLAEARQYLQMNSLVRVLIAVAGLVASAMCFARLTIFPSDGQGWWFVAALSISLTVASVPVALTAGLSIPPEVLSLAGIAGAIVSAGIAVFLAWVPVQAFRRIWRARVCLVIALASSLSLLVGQAGASWGPLFALWPATLIAIGQGLALTVLGGVIFALAVAGVRATIVGVNRSLRRDAIIREQEHVIAQQSEDLEAAIHRRAVLEERERFSRDIHDGLGGSLLSLLVQVRSGHVASGDLEAALEDNLDELRMMIDSLDHGERSLNSALSTFQTRVRHLFDNAKVQLAWTQPEVALPERATPDLILHLYRILQEAGSNIVRHSQATRAEYRIDWDADQEQLLVSISDNGIAPASLQGRQTGNGLKNMARRVEEMSGTFDAGPATDGGWSIRFSLPV